MKILLFFLPALITWIIAIIVLNSKIKGAEVFFIHFCLMILVFLCFPLKRLGWDVFWWISGLPVLSGIAAITQGTITKGRKLSSRRSLYIVTSVYCVISIMLASGLYFYLSFS